MVRPHMAHNIASGRSYGVFDTEYRFKYPESTANGLGIYWNVEDVNADRQTLLHQLDFPLVAMAFSVDQYHAGIAKGKPEVGSSPAPRSGSSPITQLFHAEMAKLDPRDPATWSAKAPGEVLMRNGTLTREGYGGQGIMRYLSHFVMRRAHELGYHAMSITTLSDAVAKVWLGPPEPWRAEVVARLDPTTYEGENDFGQRVNLFEPCTQEGILIWLYP